MSRLTDTGKLPDTPEKLVDELNELIGEQHKYVEVTPGVLSSQLERDERMFLAGQRALVEMLIRYKKNTEGGTP